MGRKLDFVSALKVAELVLEQYKLDQPRWFKRMDGTPILNDVAVRMAKAFSDRCGGECVPVVHAKGCGCTDCS